jgi:hypothetical protein
MAMDPFNGAEAPVDVVAQSLEEAAAPVLQWRG